MASTAAFLPFLDLMWPTVLALRELGGSARTDQISEAVIEAEGLAAEPPADGFEGSTLEQRLTWARNYLKNIGAIENNARDVWSLAALGRRLTEDEIAELVREYTHRCSI